MTRIDQRLLALLERHLDGSPASLTEPDWEEVTRVVRAAGVGNGDDASIRAAIERHALYLVLTRSGVPELEPDLVQALVGRFGSVAALAAASPQSIAAAAPGLPDGAIERLQRVLTAAP